VLVMKRLLVRGGSLNGWHNFGFDMDGLCTDLAQPDALRACRGDLIGDGVDGRDNAFGVRVGPILAFGDLIVDDVVTQSVTRGRVVPALRITDWSGGNDAQLRVEFLTAIDGRGPDGSATLSWNGHDTWRIESTVSLDAESHPIEATSDAFYSCGWFGAESVGVTHMYLPHRDEVRRFVLRHPRLGGAFSPDTGGTLDFSALNNYEDYVGNLPWTNLCPAPHPNAMIYDMALAQARHSFDVLQSGAVDPSAECDAMSVGFRTEWVAAELRDTVAMPALFADPCGTARSDAGVRDGAVDAGTDGAADARPLSDVSSDGRG
jgi:hypothetical protein